MLVDKRGKMLKTSVFREKLYRTNGVFAFDSNHSNNAKRAVVVSFDRVRLRFSKMTVSCPEDGYLNVAETSLTTFRLC